jgi:hypothetical protein
MFLSSVLYSYCGLLPSYGTGMSSLISRYSKSGHSCLTAESLLNGKNAWCLYMLAITDAKRKAKARIAE